jgi:hypothetical protein
MESWFTNTAAVSCHARAAPLPRARVSLVTPTSAPPRLLHLSAPAAPPPVRHLNQLGLRWWPGAPPCAASPAFCISRSRSEGYAAGTTSKARGKLQSRLGVGEGQQSKGRCGRNEWEVAGGAGVAAAREVRNRNRSRRYI